jgi:hypothetical protein
MERLPARPSLAGRSQAAMQCIGLAHPAGQAPPIKKGDTCVSPFLNLAPPAGLEPATQ